MPDERTATPDRPRRTRMTLGGLIGGEHDDRTGTLETIYSHLHAAVVQTIDSDDQIIARHVRAAYALTGDILGWECTALQTKEPADGN